MIKLYLTRHGQTEENLTHIFQGHLPGILSAEGRRQAHDLGEQLLHIHLDAIVSSDLQRVKDTIHIAMGSRTLPWHTTPLLREIDWGSWTGLKVASVDTTHLPDDAETREMLYARAGRALAYIRQHYEGKSILVVGHGLINRSLQAHILNLPCDRLTEIAHMNNCELREFTLR